MNPRESIITCRKVQSEGTALRIAKAVFCPTIRHFFMQSGRPRNREWGERKHGGEGGDTPALRIHLGNVRKGPEELLPISPFLYVHFEFWLSRYAMLWKMGTLIPCRSFLLIQRVCELEESRSSALEANFVQVEEVILIWFLEGFVDRCIYEAACMRQHVYSYLIAICCLEG